MLLLFTHTITPRLQYVIDFISTELFETPIRIVTDEVVFRSYDGPKFNYSSQDFLEEVFSLQPHPLLFETDIKPQVINCFELNFNKVFFQTKGNLPFDILAAIFYLISRYEEYLPHQKDQYGRYAYENSLAWKENFLQVPLINNWLHDFKKLLQQKFPQLMFRRQQFKFIPTYDIDIAYSYSHKGLLRNAGGLLRSLIKGRWKEINERLAVLSKRQKDPFDAYEWMDALHLYCKVKPVYFFLVAQRRKEFDKNIPISSASLQELIAYFSKTCKVGLHPSWQSSVSEKATLLKEEKEWMEVVIEEDIIESRQHYIKFSLPATYRRLIEVGIQHDYSMGYGSVNGFRASLAAPFYWFDLEMNKPTALKIFPFCFMEATAYYQQKKSPKEAYEELKQYYNQLKKLNGLFITIWHNHFLGTDAALVPWKEMYELFMKENVY